MIICGWLMEVSAFKTDLNIAIVSLSNLYFVSLVRFHVYTPFHRATIDVGFIYPLPNVQDHHLPKTYNDGM